MPKPEPKENNPVRMLLRDRDTGEMVLHGTMDMDGNVNLIEVGEGYIDLLKQIGISVGDA